MYRRLLGSWILSRPASACHHLPPGSRIAPRRVHSPPYAPLTRSLQLPIIRGGVAFRGVAIACCFFALGLVGFEWRLGGRRAGHLGHWRRGVGRYESMECRMRGSLQPLCYASFIRFSSIFNSPSHVYFLMT